LADPAPLELWALQTAPTRVRLGVRLTDRRMRQRSGRGVERRGALRPVVAAGMLMLAEPSTALRLPGLDPCRRAVTVARVALAPALGGFGADIAADATRAARSNLPPGAPLVIADARALPFPSGFAGAIISNLPFGRRFHVEQPVLWLQRAFIEFERV